MSRPERIEYPGAVYHVMNRGRNRQSVFSDEPCFHAFLDTLAEAVSRFNVEVHAYCLMTNHYHLLLSTPEGNLQRAMRHIGGVYTQRYNRLKRTDGALFKGRYKAIVVDSDEYLLHVSKYIHLNPLEANMVDMLSDYPWSSYPAYVGKTKPASWLNRSEVYDQLTAKRMKAKKYQAFVEEIDLLDDVMGFYNKKRTSPILGNQQFRESLPNKAEGQNTESPRYERAYARPSYERIIDEVATHFNVKADVILVSRRGRGAKNFPRKVAMYLAQRLGGYKLTEIANHFGLSHYGGVGASISQVKNDMIINRVVKNDVNSIVKRFDP